MSSLLKLSLSLSLSVGSSLRFQSIFKEEEQNNTCCKIGPKLDCQCSLVNILRKYALSLKDNLARE